MPTPYFFTVTVNIKKIMDIPGINSNLIVND